MNNFFDIIISIPKSYNIGGLETFFYIFCKRMSNKYNILLLYSEIDEKQKKRLLPYAQVERNNLNNVYHCNTLINLRYIDFMPNNVIAKQKIQMIHGCKEESRIKNLDTSDLIVCVSDAVAKSFETELKNVQHITIKNLLDYSNQKQLKPLKLISTTRTNEKSKGGQRLKQFAELLYKNHYPFTWLIFTNKQLNWNIPGVIEMPPTLDISNYIADSDYLVQLSDMEAFCYSIVEALQLGTPVLVTPITVLPELKVEDGKNGYILPFDMNNIDLNKIYNNIPKFEYDYDNKTPLKQWEDIIDKGVK